MFGAQRGERRLAGAVVGVALTRQARARLGPRGASGGRPHFEVAETLRQVRLQLCDSAEPPFEEPARPRALLERGA